MWFNSWEFLYFLPIVLLCYYALQYRAQNAFLLLASYFFYGWWDWRFLSLLMASTIVDYFAARWIARESDPARRRLGLACSLGMNLGALATFKYFNFFVDSFVALGDALGTNFDTPVMRLFPPVGISFYTFQTLSYTIDVYRGQLRPARSFVEFALFVSYFPQLVAGPIERAGRLLPQITRQRVVDAEMLRTGLLLILIGYFKKIAIADTVAPTVDQIFANPQSQSSLELLKGLYLFSLQIYCDFSGYSSIARGVSRLLGIELSENFQTPYLARNITEFWRRWHISLSRWLRDYLYIPLGGNRHGKWQTYRNLMVTMLLGGLWHGASWTFVVWGGLHGAFLAAHKFLRGNGSSAADAGSAGEWTLVNIMKTVLTFHLVAITWIFFRAQNFNDAWDFLSGLLLWHGSLSPAVLAKPVALIALLLPLELAQYRCTEVLALRRWPALGRAAYYLIMILSTILLGGNDVPFIYFQF